MPWLNEKVAGLLGEYAELAQISVPDRLPAAAAR
jgi:hypothetical protein